MARRTEDFEIDPKIVLIDDDTDTSPAAMDRWLELLHTDQPVSTTTPAAEIVREIRKQGEV